MEGSDTRIYEDKPEEEGKFFIELPFGGWIEVDEERFKEEQERDERVVENQRKNNQQRHRNKELLDNLGYGRLDHHLDPPETAGYENRLVEVMQAQGLSHVDEIPKIIREISASQEAGRDNREDCGNTISSTVLVASDDIFSSFTVNLYEQQDRYDHAILSLIDRYEKFIAHRMITKEEYEEIYKLFKMGHVTNLKLYHKFEQLKKQEKIYFYQRLFTFDTNVAQHGYDPLQPPSETHILGTTSRHIVYYVLVDGRVTKEEMEPDAKKFHEKIKRTYEKVLKEKIGGQRVASFNSYDLLPTPDDIFDTLSVEQKAAIKNALQDIPYIKRENYWEQMLPHERNPIVQIFLDGKDIQKYSGAIMSCEKRNVVYDNMSSHKMQNVFGFSREELCAIINETKIKFIEEFINTIHNLTSASFVNDGSSLKIALLRGRRTTSPNIAWKNIAEILQAIEEAGPYYAIATEGLRELVREKVTNILYDQMQKLESKELVRFKNLSRDERKKNSYKSQLTDHIVKADIASDVLEKLGFANDDVVLIWKENQKMLVQAFLEKHTGDFVTKRKETLIKIEKLDTSSIEKIRPQIVKKVTEKFIVLYNKFVDKQKKEDSFFDFRGVSRKDLHKFLENGVLFADGYLTLMKDMMPVATKRKSFWKEVKKEIASNVLQDACDKLMNPTTVEHAAYFALSPLKRLLKRYDGKLKDISINDEQINTNYYAYALSLMDVEMKRRISAIERFLAGKGKKDMLGVYKDFGKLTMYLHSFLHGCFFRHTADEKNSSVKEEVIMDHFTSNKENYSGQYPGNFLIALSRIRVSPDKVEEAIPPHILQPIVAAFQRVAILQEKFFRLAVENRVLMNALPGGKLERVVADNISSAISPEQARNIAIDYIIENIDTMVVQDLAVMLHGIKIGDMFSRDEEAFIRESVAVILEQWKQKMGQKSIGGDSNLEIS